jgi:hypothetical protein
VHPVPFDQACQLMLRDRRHNRHRPGMDFAKIRAPAPHPRAAREG